MRPNVPLVLLSLLLVQGLSVAPARADRAESTLPRDKCVLSTVLLNPEHEANLRASGRLDDGTIDRLLAIARREAAAALALRMESDAALAALDSDDARREWVRESGFNEHVRGIVHRAWREAESELDAREREAFLQWLGDRWEIDRTRAREGAGSDGLRYTVFMTQYAGYTNYEIALPDKYLKFANLGWEYHPGYQSPPYNATLRYNGRTVTAVGVLEVGPWNIDDNYWNPASHPERPRRLFNDLPQGMPESQAAYYDNYNNGKDQYGRTVVNPSACDATPAVAADLGLAYLQNAWVEVEYLWESSGGTDLIVDDPTARTRGGWTRGTSSSDKYGTSYLWASTEPGGNRIAYWAVNLPAAGTYDLYAWWPQGSNRSSSAKIGTRIQGVTHSVRRDQRTNGGQWNYIGTYSYPAGVSYVGVSNDAPSGSVVICDAMKLVKR